MAGDLRGWLADARIVDAPTWEILDAPAAERMADRSDEGRTAKWARSLIGRVRDSAGLLDAAAVIPFLALRDATEAGAPDRDLLPVLHETAQALSRMRMPADIEASAWWPMRLAAIGLLFRLDAMSASRASQAC